MSDNKTKITDVPVSEFLATVEPERKREDAIALDAMLQRITGEPARMWGASIVGYGQYHYKYDSGREGDSFLTGFSPRKQNISIYIMPGFKPFAEQLATLGKHKVSKGSCLYINKLADVDATVLEGLIRDSVAWMKKKYGAST